MRTTHPYVFYDDPSRLLRLVRLRVRLGFTVEERTRAQYDNARAAHLEELISPHQLFVELKHMAGEPSPPEVVRALQEGGLLGLYSPALSGPKLNMPGLLRLEKAEHLVETANGMPAPKLPLFLYALTGKLTAREKAALVKAADIPKAEMESLRNLEPRARKVETSLKSERIRKASQVYEVLAGVPRDELAFLLCHSTQRVVQERIRNYLQKYLPAMQELPQSEWDAIEGQPGTAKYKHNRHALIAAHLDVRPRKPQPEPEPEMPAEVVIRGRAR
jgi:tRNA nucleotidyltransferase/poly(A) polymerase